MVFFKINTTNITPWIDIQDYKMNREDIFEEWEDANWNLHRVIARTKISGEFKVGFSKATDFAALVALLGTEKTADGYYPVEAYCNNTGTNETFYAFLDVTDEDKWDLTNGRQWQAMTIKVTGR